MKSRGLTIACAVFAGIAMFAGVASAQSLPSVDEEITGRVIVLDQPVHMVFQTVPRKNMGAEVTESIGLTNSSSNTLASGVLQIQFPAGITLISASPTFITLTANIATFDVPALAPGQSFLVTFTVSANRPELLAMTAGRYFVGGAELGFITGGEEFMTTGAVAGIAETPETGGAAAATALPVTGIPVNALPQILLYAAGLGAALLGRRKFST